MTTADPRLEGRDPYDGVADETNLTKDQLLVWTGQQVHPDHRRYSELALFHIDGPVDVDRFGAALDAVVRAHDALRIVIDVDGPWPRQVVGPHGTPLQLLDVAAEPDPDAAFRRRLAAWTAEPFPSGRPPWRSLLVRRAADRFVWALNQHQLIGDAWSFGLIVRSLHRRYAGVAPERSTSAPQFLEYVDWERRYRRSAAYRRSGRYWAERLAAASEAPTFYEGRSGGGTGRLERVAGDVGTLTAGVTRLAAALPGGLVELNVFAVFCAAAIAYVARLSGLRTVVVGVPYANRGSQRFKDTVGSFMHICPLRVDLDPTEPFAALLERVRAEAVAAGRHQQYAVRNPVRARLYDVVVNYQRHVWLLEELAGARLRAEWPTLGVGNHALAVQVSRFAASRPFEVGLDLDVDAFPTPYRDAALAHYRSLLGDALRAPATAVGRLRLDSADHEHGRARSAAATVAQPALPTLLALVERRVAEHPARTAVVTGAEAWTYAELWAAGRRVAASLAARGIGRGDVVGVATARDRDGWTIVLGILLSGAAYLPLDREHPPARLGRIVRQARCRAVVATVGARPRLDAAWSGAAADARPLLLDAGELVSTVPPSVEPAAPPRGEDLFYVIFTSGSTGVPKGIMVEHRGMTNHALAKIDVLGIGDGDRVAQTAPFTFDVSVWQWFAPLCRGAEVHLVDDGIARDPHALIAELTRRRITIAATVPAMLRAIVEALESMAGDARPLATLRRLVVTGEVLPPELCRRWLAVRPDVPLVNAYGPSECSDDVSHHVVTTPPAASECRIPIGRPIANTTIWVLDEQRAPVPAGVPGELWIGGVGVARGYLDDAERTAEAFVPDPFSTAPAARLFRTGDLGWCRRDGVLEFAGRGDRMIKIRGQRVEPGEVEAVLCQHPAVRDAVITSPEDATGDRRLVAYVVAAPDAADGAGLDGHALRRFVAERLPECMVPALVVVLSRLPLSANGKVDHAALPVAEGKRQDAIGELVAPRTSLERAIAEIWSGVLDVRPIGVHDRLFELGGDSLRAAHIAHRVRARWSVETPLHVVLTHPTVALLAAWLESRLDEDERALAAALDEVEAMSECEAAAAVGAGR